MPLVNTGPSRRERGRPLPPPASTSGQRKTGERDVSQSAYTMILVPQRAPSLPSGMLSTNRTGPPNLGTQS